MSKDTGDYDLDVSRRDYEIAELKQQLRDLVAQWRDEAVAIKQYAHWCATDQEELLDICADELEAVLKEEKK